MLNQSCILREKKKQSKDNPKPETPLLFYHPVVIEGYCLIKPHVQWSIWARRPIRRVLTHCSCLMDSKPHSRTQSCTHIGNSGRAFLAAALILQTVGIWWSSLWRRIWQIFLTAGWEALEERQMEVCWCCTQLKITQWHQTNYCTRKRQISIGNTHRGGIRGIRTKGKAKPMKISQLGENTGSKEGF